MFIHTYFPVAYFPDSFFPGDDPTHVVVIVSLQHQTTVKSWFQTGDIPTQSQFNDFIESSMPEWQVDVAIQVDQGAAGILNILSTVSATCISATAAVANGLPTWLRLFDASVATHNQAGAIMMVDSSAAITLVSGRGDIRNRTGYLWAALTTANSGAQNAALIDSCVSALGANGGTVRLPAGAYLCSNIGTVTNSVKIEGAGSDKNGTILKCSAVQNPMFPFDGGDGCALKHVQIQSAVNRTSGFAVRIAASATRFQLEDVHIHGMYDGVHVGTSFETRIDRILITNPTGTCGIRTLDPAGANFCQRTHITNFTGSVPISISTQVSSKIDYATTTSIASGRVTVANGFLWENTQNGTTGSTAPSAIPGTTGIDAFTTDVTDGTVIWRYRGQKDFAWLKVDNGTHHLNASGIITYGNGRSVWVHDTIASGATGYMPHYINIDRVMSDKSFETAIAIHHGRSIGITNSQVIFCINGYGIFAGGATSGVFRFVGNSLTGIAQDGIFVDNGVGNTVVANNTVTLYGMATASNVRDGIRIQASAMRTAVVGNVVGSSPLGTAGGLRDILIDTGNPNMYAVVGNVTYGAQFSILDSGSGTYKPSSSVTALNACGVP